jgi:3-deoxy-D-manno-octulosonic-acid transferase
MSGFLLVLYQLLATVGFVAAAPFLLWRGLGHRREMVERLGWTGGPAPVPCSAPAPRWQQDPRGRAASSARDDASSSGRGDVPRSAPGPTPGAPGPLWLHAASLGELESLRALWETPDRAPVGPLLVTVLSVSARHRAEEVAPAGTRVRFAPLDLWCAALPFLCRERPRALVLVETELWPLTLALCHLQGIPVALVSGHLSSRRWRRTQLLAPLLRPLLRRLAGCAVQSADDAARFRFLGAGPVEITGNLKYRLTGDPSPRSMGDGRFVLVAGSVRTGEEGVLEAGRLPGVLCVIAPRHLREREHWIGACEARGVRWVARSAIELKVPPAGGLRDPGARAALRERLDAVLAAAEDGGRPVLLVDRHGELGAWYATADAAFVGGTLVPIGGHNLFEPARCGVPVAFGPHTAGVEEAAEPLLRLGGGARVRDGAELVAWVRHLRDDPSAAVRGAAGAAAAARAMAEGAGRTLDFLHRFEWFGVPRAGQLASVNDTGPAGGAPAANDIPRARVVSRPNAVPHAEATPGPDEATR